MDLSRRMKSANFMATLVGFCVLFLDEKKSDYDSE